MKFWYALLILLVGSYVSTAADKKPITIVVIDTGFTQPENFPNPNFCKFGHADLTQKDPHVNTVPTDSHGHGTNIVYLIENQLKDISQEKYCIVVIKYWTPSLSGNIAVQNTTRALNRVKNMKIDFVNYSSFGDTYDFYEEKAIKEVLNRGSVVIAAAGNKGARIVSELEMDTTKFPHTCSTYASCTEKVTTAYPANYDDRIVVVGNLAKDGSREKSSNWGDRVNAWEIGMEMSAGGYVMSGTSQSTAVHTGKMVRQIIIERMKNGT